jgi:hypothetical protein
MEFDEIPSRWPELLSPRGEQRFRMISAACKETQTNARGKGRRKAGARAASVRAKSNTPALGIQGGMKGRVVGPIHEGKGDNEKNASQELSRRGILLS